MSGLVGENPGPSNARKESTLILRVHVPTSEIVPKPLSGVPNPDCADSALCKRHSSYCTRNLLPLFRRPSGSGRPVFFFLRWLGEAREFPHGRASVPPNLCHRCRVGRKLLWLHLLTPANVPRYEANGRP